MEQRPPIKEWGRRFRVALVYPNAYEIGMANLGLHALYRAINGTPGMLADRFFVAPRAKARPLSIERGMPATEYDCIAFTLHFEADYPNVPAFLAAAGLDPRAAGRSDGDPHVVAGGLAPSANPEPIAEFVDAVFIGEFEGGGAPLFSTMEDLASRGAGRPDSFEALSALPHVYVPSVARFVFDGPRTVSFCGHGRARLPVESAHPGLAGALPPATAVHTNRAEFSDMHLVEVTRGCVFGCRFCMAGFVARPFRGFDEKGVLEATADTAGRDKVGMVGELFAGHPAFGRIVDDLAHRGLRVSPSSVRAEHLDDVTLGALARAGLRTLTLAPETPSPRLSRAVNKAFDSAAFLGAVERAVAAGIERIKLYFMVGLPGETDDDVAAIPALAREVRGIVAKPRRRSRLGALSVSVNPFVPKAWTPLQWASMDRPESIGRKAAAVTAALKGVSNVEVRCASAIEALWEAVLSRADRRAADLVERAAREGWKAALRAGDLGFPAAEFALRERAVDETFPWEVVSHGCSREYLRDEHDRYRRAETTPPCDVAVCRACGACG